MNRNWLHEPDEPQIHRVFSAQQAHALHLRTSSATQRRDKLRRLRAALTARRQQLQQACAADFNKPAIEVELTELMPVLEEIHLAIRKLPRWMRGYHVAPTLSALGSSARVTYQAKGSCLIIGPWNYPVATLIGPLVSAVAAGNTVLLKPSEFTPAVNAVLADIVAEVFLPNEVSMVSGAVEVTQALLALPFDHIFFTGSTAVGKIVMRAAAEHLASVTLELGGKSPVIVDQSADLKRAAELVMWGKLVNAGQSCIAPDTLFVHRRVKDELIALCTQLLRQRFGTDPHAIASNPDLARLISSRHAARIAALIDEARLAGATVHAGGQYDVDARYVAPTLIGDLPPQASLLQEEIFGPVLPVVVFDEVDALIAQLNTHPKPLALYLWSRHAETIARVRSQCSSGSIVINHCMQQYTHTGLPFGGVNHSGLGSAHGLHGFKAFSHERAQLRGGRWLPVTLFFPPYTAAKLKLARWLVALVGR
ncbi:aldehyde dehydrogenase (NAD+) [Herbaspirillum rubrisubalbicans]|uniref:aldehyde dehydrogenase family protein n=1 Tax=Herbaspirillum rubrisubalbicans TaxID=80842 RepID=UPI00209F7C6B|nr:aldehyde dehydrogenase family protein [Herbaspirillum rubrisubalbicans]MCP1576468.1 aldehyde dehydrogenase (NAD+) [Herbaspirillum rubrisubalbicans]